MVIEHVSVAVLGAGVAGLGAVYNVNELGRCAVIFEACPAAVGLLDNFMIDGFRFDYACADELVRRVFDRTYYHTHPPVSFCFESYRRLKHQVLDKLCPQPAGKRVAPVRSL